MIKLALYTFFDLLGIGCLVSLLVLAGSISEVAFVGLVGGAGIACLGMGSLLAFVEAKSRHSEKPLYTRPSEPQPRDYAWSLQGIH